MKKIALVLIFLNLFICFIAPVSFAEDTVILDTNFDTMPTWLGGEAFSIVGGALRLSGNAYANFSGAKNYQVESKVKFEKFALFQFAMRAKGDEQYCFLIRNSETNSSEIEFMIIYQAGTVWNPLSVKAVPASTIKLDTFYDIKTVAEDELLSFYFDGKLQTQVSNNLIPAKGMTNFY